MEKVSGLIERLKKYPEIFRIINNLYKFSKGEVSGEELYNIFEPYIGMDLELFEKIMPILKSDEVWGDGRTVYKTRVYLDNGEAADVTVNRDVGFVVVDRHGEKEVHLKYSLNIKKDREEWNFSATT